MLPNNTTPAELRADARTVFIPVSGKKFPMRSSPSGLQPFLSIDSYPPDQT